MCRVFSLAERNTSQPMVLALLWLASPLKKWPCWCCCFRLWSFKSSWRSQQSNVIVCVEEDNGPLFKKWKRLLFKLWLVTLWMSQSRLPQMEIGVHNVPLSLCCKQTPQRHLLFSRHESFCRKGAGGPLLPSKWVEGLIQSRACSEWPAVCK